MEQHPVPQHISSYEFKLVGDMTIKQFFQLAGGVLVALIFYATPLPGIIKWPLVMLFALIGAALAFLPIRERPLSVWFLAFIRAIYAPTVYVYKDGGAEEIFRTDGQSPEVEIVTPMGTQRAEEYLSEIPKTSIEEKFDKSEETFFQKVGSFFHTTHQPTPTSSAPTFPSQSGPTPQPQSAPIPPEDVAPPRQVPVYVQVVEEENDTVSAPAPTEVPVQQQTHFPPQTQPAYAVQPSANPFQNTQPQTQPSQNPIEATFTTEASPPLPPDRPNTIVGQVTTHDGKIVDSAILEIRDNVGKPVRAIRTNKVGHFITVTPINNGGYEIETEKDDLKFDVVKFKAEGGIIPPILIRAKE